MSGVSVQKRRTTSESATSGNGSRAQSEAIPGSWHREPGMARYLRRESRNMLCRLSTLRRRPAHGARLSVRYMLSYIACKLSRIISVSRNEHQLLEATGACMNLSVDRMVVRGAGDCDGPAGPHEFGSRIPTILAVHAGPVVSMFQRSTKEVTRLIEILCSAMLHGHWLYNRDTVARLLAFVRQSR